jgi:hypothetical protein
MRPEVEPWRALPASVATAIEPGLEAATQDILDSIGREVPAYARPLEGSFGRALRSGVTEALGQFVALIRDPDADRTQGHEVYRALGAGELRQGRTLDSLQAAYRVGARVAWRHAADAAHAAGLDPPTLSLLAESIFAYIDQLSADSVDGYAEAIAAREDERFRRRRALAELLLGEPAVDEATAREAASSADWSWPREVAALACREEKLDRLRSRLPVDALVNTVGELGCVVIPDPRGPGRERELRQTVSGMTAALGPVCPPVELASSWRLARAAFEARERDDGLVLAEDHLGELLLNEGAPIVGAIARRRLGELDRLGKSARERMEATALAYVQHAGNAAAMGRALHVHPQTVRHRLRRLSDLLGDQLDEPKARFELEAALLYRSLGA